MGDKVKKEHYVPRTYLRYFATNHKIFVFDKEKAEVRTGSIEDYACERYFYDVDFESIMHDQKEENQLYEFSKEVEESLQNIDLQHIEHFYGNTVETTLFSPVNSFVEYVNSLQVIHSYRYVFSNDGDFALATKMINDYPELRKINRDRFQFG